MSGSILKLIACIVMLIDHIAAFLPGDFMGMRETLFMIGDKAVTLRMLMHYIGRSAFPIFAFLITEGFIHTRDRKKYAINLLLFGLYGYFIIVTNIKSFYTIREVKFFKSYTIAESSTSKSS